MTTSHRAGPPTDFREIFRLAIWCRTRVVRIKKEIATQALALSRPRHGNSSTGSRNATPMAAREPSEHSLEKTESDPKKTRQRRPSEEDGSTRRCTFTPAESIQIRVGGHIPRSSPLAGCKLRCGDVMNYESLNNDSICEEESDICKQNPGHSKTVL